MAARNVVDAQLRFCFSPHFHIYNKWKRWEKILKKIYPEQRRKNNKLTFRTDSHVHMGKYRQTHDNQEQDHLSWGSGGKWGITLRFNCWTAQVLAQGPTGELRYWAHPPMSNGNIFISISFQLQLRPDFA